MNYFDDSRQLEIENNLPSYKKVCRAIYRCLEIGTVLITDLEYFLDEYKKYSEAEMAKQTGDFLMKGG